MDQRSEKHLQSWRPLQSQNSAIVFEDINLSQDVINHQDMSPLRHANQLEHRSQQDLQPPQEFTEVFSWGSDRHGQLGLGKQANGTQVNYDVPRLCSYNIPILQVSCGASHTALITSKS